MLSELIQLSFDKIIQMKSYTIVVLKGQEKSFGIYMEPTVGRILQQFLTEVPNPRPLTHELLFNIFAGMDVQVKQIVITEVEDTIYFARLFLEQQREHFRHIIEVDARPSDCLILALMQNSPVYCTKEVIEKAIAMEE